MEVKLQISKADYKKFFKSYFFKKHLPKRILLLVVISIWIGTSTVNGQTSTSSAFFIKASITAILLFILIVLAPYVIASINLRKSLKTIPPTIFQTIATNDEEITVTRENETIFWKWETLKEAEIINGYLFFSLFTNKYYLIPLKSFSSNNEAVNFLGIIKNGILKVRGENTYRKIQNLYYWGLAGILPNFGVIAGIVLIVKGFKYDSTILVVIGSADILFTVVFWTVLFRYLAPS